MPKFKGALCRGARSLLGGWSIAELSNCSGVSVSTITAFESERRIPIPSNHNVLLSTLQEHGVIFIDADANDGSGLRLTKTAEVVRDITGPLRPDESIDDRVASAVERTEKFEEEAGEAYGATMDAPAHVQADISKLRDAIRREISRRIRLRKNDCMTQVLEKLIDRITHQRRK